MSKVRFKLTLSPTRVGPTTVRLWVDRSGNDVLESDEEVMATTTDGKVWQAAADLTKPQGTFFRVKFLAPVGTTWKFEAKDGSKTRCAIAEQTTAFAVEQFVDRLG